VGSERISAHEFYYFIYGERICVMDLQKEVLKEGSGSISRSFGNS
jgi:hypothetical protein